MDADNALQGTVRPEALQADLDRLSGSVCRRCPAVLCAHDVLYSIILGFKDAPQCGACLASGLGRSRDELAGHLANHIRRRECWSFGWQWANTHEGYASDEIHPACVWHGGSSPAVSVGRMTTDARQAMQSDQILDAGDMGCGDLVLELRVTLNAMEPRRILKVVARDPGAPEDIPAWCGLTGHALLEAKHPVYFIQRKD